MTVNEALAILDRHSNITTKRDPTDKNRILQGLTLLASVDSEFDTDKDFAVMHDQIFADEFARSVRHMSEEQLLQMRRWGWFYSEDSWSHFT